MSAIESLEEVKLIMPGETGKYRKMIEEFLAMDSKIGRLTFDFRAQARNAAKRLSFWVKRGEKINIIQKGYVVYLVKEE